MNRFFSALIAILILAFLAVPAPARAEVSGKMNFQSGAVVYYGLGTYVTGKSVDTIIEASDRNWLDTADYDIAVFISSLDAVGPLRCAILNDSSFIVTSATAGDSLKSWYYWLVYRPK